MVDTRRFDPAPAGAVPFIQYLQPHGLPVPQVIDRPPEVAAVAQALAAKGYKFTASVQPGDRVRLVCAAPDGATAARDEVPNGPGVPEAVDRLVAAAAEYETARPGQKLWYREDLDESQAAGCQGHLTGLCPRPHPHPTDHPLFLHSRCHPAEPTWAAYRDGVLTVTCSACGGLVARIAVAARPPAEGGAA